MLLLPDSYYCEMARQTRSAGMVCTCKWCWLAKLSGSTFKQWQRKVTGRERSKVSRLCQECFQGVQEGRSHSCSVSTLEAVRNLTASLPLDVREKLALETIRRKSEENGAGGDIVLPKATGGHPVHVQVGTPTNCTKPKEQISCKEVLTMAASAHLTGKQTDSILSDMRSKLGRRVIEPGVKAARAQHNSQYKVGVYICILFPLF